MPSSTANVRVVGPAEFAQATGPANGINRPAAIAPELGVVSSLWAGLFEVEPGAHTEVHHHGDQETIAYVLSGVSEVRWGTRGEHQATVKAGDFVHIPAFLPHTELNPSGSETFRWVIVRNGAASTVVNLPDEQWA